MKSFKFIASLAGAVLFLVFGLILATLNLSLCMDILHQSQALSYPTTTGKVLSSEVAISHSSKGGTSYRPQILYEYQVDGRTYRGTTYRYVRPLPPTDSIDAYAAVRARPVGSETTVYYRANAPEDSLLFPGIIGFDFHILFVGVPICAILVFMAVIKFQLVWFEWNHPPAGGVRIISQGSRTRANLPRYSISTWSLGVFCATSVIAYIILTVVAARNDSVQQEAVGGVFVLAATVGVLFWRRVRRQAGVDDLVIDEAAQQITLPKTFGRKQPLFLPIKSAEAVYVAAIPHRSRYSTSYYGGVMLAVNHDSTHSQQLTDWPSKAKAVAFAEWLNERLHLPGPVNISEDL